MKVIKFVLIHPGFELISLALNDISLEVKAPQQHALGADDLDVEPRDRQTSLVVNPLTVCFDNLGVQNDMAAVVEVPDEDLLLHADLRCSECNSSVAVIKRVEHLVDESNESTIDIGDGRSLGLEHRIAEGADLVGHTWQATPSVAHYFDPRPDATSDPQVIEVNLPDIAFTYRSDAGVFSNGRLDNGTGVLLRSGIEPRTTGRICDLGCGAGPIAISLALRSPAAEIWAIDVNERARQLTAENASALDCTIHVTDPDDVPMALTFDEVWSNPPIRVGKAAMDELIFTWLGRLAPGGRMVLVISKHLGADSLQRRLETAGWVVDRVMSRIGFRVLSITMPTEALPT